MTFGFVIVALLVAATASPAVVNASDDSSAAATVTFRADTIEEHRGDIVRIPLQLDGTNNATITLHWPSNETISMTVVDEDGNGQVDLLVNTFLAGRDDDDAITADATDRVSIGSTGREPAMPAGTYNVEVAPGTGTDMQATDQATLLLTERRTGDLIPWATLLTDRAALSSPTDIRTGQERGSLRQVETPPNVGAIDRTTIRRIDPISAHDVLVTELHATGLSGVLAAQEGSNETARFFELVARDDVTLRVRSPTVSTCCDPVVLDLTSFDATTVVTDPANDTYYLVTDVDAMPVSNPGEFGHGDEIDLTFAISDDSELAPRDDAGRAQQETVSSNTTFVDHRVRFLGGSPVRVAPRSSRSISATTTLPEGTPITVVARATGNATFERSTTTTVGADSRFEALLDFDGVQRGAAFDLTVYVRDHRIATTSGLADRVNASVDVADVDRDEENISVRADVRLDDGGFLVVHANDTDGTPRYVEYVEPGLHRNVSFTWEPGDADRFLVALYRDRQDDGEFDHADHPYVSNGSRVAVAITPSPSPTSVPSATAPFSPTAPSGTPAPPLTNSTSTIRSTPAFSILEAAGVLIALVFLAALRGRR